MKTKIIKTALISSFLLGMLEADTMTSQSSLGLQNIITNDNNKSLQDNLNALHQQESHLKSQITSLQSNINSSLNQIDNLLKQSGTATQQLNQFEVYLKRIYDSTSNVTLDKSKRDELSRKSGAIKNAISAFDKASKAGTAVKSSMTNYAKNLNELSTISAQIASQQALIKLRENVLDSINQTQSSLASLSNAHRSNTQMLDFVSSLNTQTRLAKLSNPHYQDSYFAQWIESIKNQALAANTIKTSKQNPKAKSVLGGGKKISYPLLSMGMTNSD